MFVASDKPQHKDIIKTHRLRAAHTHAADSPPCILDLKTHVFCFFFLCVGSQVCVCVCVCGESQVCEESQVCVKSLKCVCVCV